MFSPYVFMFEWTCVKCYYSHNSVSNCNTDSLCWIVTVSWLSAQLSNWNDLCDGPVSMVPWSYCWKHYQINEENLLYILTSKKAQGTCIYRSFSFSLFQYDDCCSNSIQPSLFVQLTYTAGAPSVTDIYIYTSGWILKQFQLKEWQFFLSANW